MGDNSDKKTIRVTYFFMRNPYMKCQNISIHDSKHMLWPKIAKDHNSNNISFNWLKIQSVDLLLSFNHYTKCQGSSSNTF